MLRVLPDTTYARLFSAQVIALLGTRLLTVARGLLACYGLGSLVVALCASPRWSSAGA